MFGFGGGNTFLASFFSFFLFFLLCVCVCVINLSVDSEFRGAPSTFCLPTLALGLTDFRRVPRCVRTVGQETCGSGRRVEL